MSRYTVLAFDFGASSGRAIKATLDGGSLSCTEVHRFENTPVEREGTLFWDIDTLFSEVRTGIEKAGAFDSVGFDTWGVDFGLLDENGALLQSPVHYRDRRTDGMADKLCERLGEAALYEKTGNQIMNINTLFQLAALQEKNPALLARAKKLLFMPDLFAYQLTQNACCEMTIASTSQMLNPQTKTWAEGLLEGLGLPGNILLPVVPSGTVTGHCGKAKVIAVAGHDTQCAVAALPTQADDVVFLSCGTWSLLGTLVSNSAPCFHDVRTYWSPEACERVTGLQPTGIAKEGFIHLINSGATALDGSGASRDNEGNGCMKPLICVPTSPGPPHGLLQSLPGMARSPMCTA